MGFEEAMRLEYSKYFFMLLFEELFCSSQLLSFAWKRERRGPLAQQRK